MAKKHKPGPGPCVHCLAQVEKRTWDHLFPISWYPDSTPDNVERWKFPACEPCNAAYGQLEQDLLVRAGLCLDPALLQASGIPDKALRALKPEHAKGEKDRRAREARLRRVLDETFPMRPEYAQGVLPGFGPRPGALPIGIGVSPHALKRLVEKVARGLTYRRGHLIGPEYRIDMMVDPQQGAIFDGLLLKFGKREERGPGISLAYAIPHDDSYASIFSLLLWGTLQLWGVVLKNKDAHPNDGESER
jgi:hypothetical protein